MTEEVALWKQRIAERKAKGQTIVAWCEEHGITKDSYNYWRKQVAYAEGTLPKHRANAQRDTSVVFAQVKPSRVPEPVQSSLTVTWQDVTIQLTSNQEAHLAAELISSLRSLC